MSRNISRRINRIHLDRRLAVGYPGIKFQTGNQIRGQPNFENRRYTSPPEVTPATEMGQLRQNFVLQQSEAENEIYATAGFVLQSTIYKPGMKFRMSRDVE